MRPCTSCPTFPISTLLPHHHHHHTALNASTLFRPPLHPHHPRTPPNVGQPAPEPRTHPHLNHHHHRRRRRRRSSSSSRGARRPTRNPAARAVCNLARALHQDVLLQQLCKVLPDARPKCAGEPEARVGGDVRVFRGAVDGRVGKDTEGAQCHREPEPAGRADPRSRRAPGCCAGRGGADSTLNTAARRDHGRAARARPRRRPGEGQLADRGRAGAERGADCGHRGAEAGD